MKIHPIVASGLIVMALLTAASLKAQTQVSAPIFSPPAGTYTVAQAVSISTTTSGATIRYTTNGNTPSETNGTIYTGPVPTYSSGTTGFQAIAYETGYRDSSIISATYTVPPVAAAPIFGPAGGTYTGVENVIMSSSTNGATIRYTTDGSTPSSINGLVGTQATIAKSATLQAIAYETGYTPSTVTSAVYTLPPLAATPTFSPAAGAYAAGQTVSMSTATSGATIIYTVDGNIPTEGSGWTYSGPVTINKWTILKAIAYKNGVALDSPVASGLYKIGSSPAPVFNVLYNFTNTNDGPTNPHAGLTQGSDGNFYGTAYSNGVVYEITSAGAFTTLATFNGTNGGGPEGRLVQGSDGSFYGTANSGGANNDGTVFKMTPSGSLTALVSFYPAIGFSPATGLVKGSDGNFYGTTESGGANNAGTFFMVTPAGALTALASFTASPNGPPVQGSDGNFYGTTYRGGVNNQGTAFKVTPTGTLTTLVSFSGPNYANPMGALIQGTDGNFYGTTELGGANSDGTVFKMTPAGSLTTIFAFSLPNYTGSMPYTGLCQGSDGNFYGTTEEDGDSSHGTIYQMTPGGAETILAMPGNGSGSGPYDSLIQGSDGNFYGTANYGSWGMVFQVIVPFPVASPVFSPPAGTYTGAQNVTISTTTTGASIAFTTDGTTPTESGGSVTHGNLYTAPVPINATTTLRAIAFEIGVADSGGVSGVFTINPALVAAPTFNPPAGTYTSAQSVTISTTTSGASIAYTTDGSTPTESGGAITHGSLYTAPLSIASTITLNAMAFKSAMNDSTATQGVYTINYPAAAAPSFNPPAGTYTAAQSVTISTTTSGASIAYTTDGSTPTESGGTVTHGALYSGPVSINANGNTTLSAIAFATGYSDSSVTFGVYTINYPAAAAPSFNPPAGTYTAAQSVTISTTTSGASIAYTTDGSTPTESGGIVAHGALYSGPVSINANGNTALRAIAFAAGYLDSSITSGLYTINYPPPSAPIFSPAPGAYSGGQTVTISTTPGVATIRYTTDGSTPSESNGTVYSAPVNIGNTAFLKAIAYESGMPDSPVMTGLYTITSAPAAALNVLYNFATANNAGYEAGLCLLQTSDRNFYGTTLDGGSAGDGTAFVMTSSGVLTTLATFTGANGTNPEAGLVQGSDGYLYGTTVTGGAYNDGTVFKMTTAGVLSTLVSFNGTNGTYPYAVPRGLVQGNDGNFYGTTDEGGANNEGTVFKMTPTGVLNTLVSFDGANGASPDAGLVLGSDGNFYGVTFSGGSSNDGTVFKIAPTTGILTTLTSFAGSNGSFPFGGLVQGSDGNFYGMTTAGGANSDGTIYKVTPAGVLTTLVSFAVSNEVVNNGSLVQGGDGNFYGMTYNGGAYNQGTIFEMTPAGALTTLISFDSANGKLGEGALIWGSDGRLYGGMQSGGLSGYGVLFQVVPPPPQAAAPTFSPPAGAYTAAQTVAIASATSGASIAYTTDGTTPTEVGGTVTNGVQWANGGSVSIGASVTINAIAFETGYTDSAVSTAPYVINIPQLSQPAFNPPAGTYAGPQCITITAAGSGVSIRYTTDGSTPTETHGTIVSGQVCFTQTTTLCAIAYAPGYLDSPVTCATYTIVAAQAEAPVFTPSGGTYTATQAVEMQTSIGASIAYTTDGTTPTESGGTVTHGSLYAGQVQIGVTATLSAIGFGDGYTDSSVTTETYTLNLPPLSPPIFSPPAGTYTSPQTVTMTSLTPGAFIAYTTDGTAPVVSGGVVTHGSSGSSPMTVLIQGNGATLEAMAYAPNYTNSTVTNGTYTISPITPISTLLQINGSNGCREPSTLKFEHPTSQSGP